MTNQEIEAAVAEALARLRPRTGLSLLWDARQTETPLTAEDITWRFELVSSLAARDIVTRAALLVRVEQCLLLRISESDLKKALPGLECQVFTNEVEAHAWLSG